MGLRDGAEHDVRMLRHSSTAPSAPRGGLESRVEHSDRQSPCPRRSCLPIASISCGDSAIRRASQFSSRCASELVPGIGRITGDRRESRLPLTDLAGRPAFVGEPLSAELGDDHQIAPVRVVRLEDEPVGDEGAVVPGGIDEVDAKVHRAAEDLSGAIRVVGALGDQRHLYLKVEELVADRTYDREVVMFNLGFEHGLVQGRAKRVGGGYEHGASALQRQLTPKRSADSFHGNNEAPPAVNRGSKPP